MKLLYKFTAVFILIFAAVLSSVFFFISNRLKDYTYQRLRVNLAGQTAFAKSYFTQYVGQNKLSYDVDEVVDNIARDLGTQITVLGRYGTVIGDSELNGAALERMENQSEKPEIREALKSGFGESRRFSETLKEKTLYVANTFGRGRTEGIVRLAVPISKVDAIRDRLNLLLALAAFLAFIFGCFLIFAASRFIARPIGRLSRIAEIMAKGDFSKKIVFKRKDELGDLANALNAISEKARLKTEEIMANTSRLESVMHSLFDGIMLVDGKGAILSMNETLRNFLLIKEDSAGKKPFEATGNAEVQEIADDALKMEEGFMTRQISALLPHEKLFLIRATPIVRGGKNDGAILVFHDVTKLRKLEKIRRDIVAAGITDKEKKIPDAQGYFQEGPAARVRAFLPSVLTFRRHKKLKNAKEKRHK